MALLISLLLQTGERLFSGTRRVIKKYPLRQRTQDLPKKQEAE
jgi:hypothetical protein